MGAVTVCGRCWDEDLCLFSVQFQSKKSRKMSEETKTISLRCPDDWHHHFRDGERLEAVVPLVCGQFKRCIAMPNLVPPVRTTEEALAYKSRILKAMEGRKDGFEPLMTLYLTDESTPEEMEKAKASGQIVACKLYPRGATTNSANGVTDLAKLKPVLEKMAEVGLLLLVHGEVTDPDTDLFDREAIFIERHLKGIVQDFPKLKIVMEHITTKDAADFVAKSPPNVAATITAHHLLYNRNAIFQGGVRPHMYCLPVLKRETHRLALLNSIRSGSEKFFLGSDSAPHPQFAKESSCGCAGIFTGYAALQLFAEAFEEAGALENFESFCSLNGPKFYGLEPNEGKITLEKKPWKVPPSFNFGKDGALIPLRAGESISWQIKKGN